MRHSKIFLLHLVILLNACAHQPITWDRTKHAATDAAAHPSVWAPLLGASVFMIDNLDNRTTARLAKDTPVFGSDSSAGQASDDLESVLTVTAMISAATVPVPEHKNTLAHQGDHLAVTVAGISLAGMVTNTLKDSVQRERPNRSNDKSFPSGHATQAFAAATFASTNFHRHWGDSSTAQWVDAGLYTAASLTAWARVEAEAHHPTDVLAGTSIGSFVARFLDELLLKESNNTALSAYYDGKNISIGFQKSF